jgi:hypothetical protein
MRYAIRIGILEQLPSVLENLNKDAAYIQE